MAAAVLIIDDHEGTRDTFSLLLRGHGFETATAGTGRDGVALALARSFDVILVDLHLPDMRGTEVVRELKQLGVSAPIVIVTSFPELDSSFDAGCVGAAGFVAGPLFGDDVATVVRSAIDGQFPVRHPSLLITRTRDEQSQRAELVAPASRALDPRIRKVIHLIEANTAAASPEALSRGAGLSQSGLRHLFAEQVGTSLSRFIAERRVEVAARELRNSYDPIATIVHRLESVTLATFARPSGRGSGCRRNPTGRDSDGRPVRRPHRILWPHGAGKHTLFHSSWRSIVIL